MTSTPFFIVGSERSGTTMLRLMLNAHPQLFVPQESHFIFDLLQQFKPDTLLDYDAIDTALKIVTEHRRWVAWGCDEAELRNRLKAYNALTLSEFVHVVFDFANPDPKNRQWGDKTPKYSFITKELLALFPEAKFIHIVRDGRDVCVSMLKTNWYGGSISNLADLWTRYTVSADMLQGLSQCTPAQFIQIRYEDLVTNPEATLTDLCTFLRVDFDDTMLNFNDSAEAEKEIRKPAHSSIMSTPNTAHAERWRHELPRWDAIIYEAYARNILKQFGYPVSRPVTISWLLVVLIRFFINVADVTRAPRHQFKKLVTFSRKR